MTTQPNQPVRALLSIDFDFFIREDPLWDFGHSETLFGPHDLLGQAVWMIRYRGVALHQETDPARHADFLPKEILGALAGKGVHLAEGTPITVADSHRHAFDDFMEYAHSPPDMVLNLDAHHDLYPADGRGVQCDNWATHLVDEWSEATKFVQIYPRWKNVEVDQDPSREVSTTRWADWKPEVPISVAGVFVARSGSWVPPHHDEGFFRMLEALETKGELSFVEEVAKRKAPSAEEAKAMREEYKKAMEGIKTLRENPPVSR